MLFAMLRKSLVGRLKQSKKKGCFLVARVWGVARAGIA
jgi:hypothetical protein